ncbi:hypothetical protein CEE44_02320 [Candidatus Woesearchaeota archaeon B3_Woes]|nr:MAG: hypothetical protein CEE44_02320 [Candidatus Woesearchaeota archaeon B3_Woes]
MFILFLKFMKILIIHPPWPGPGFGLRSQNRWPRKRGDKTNRYPIYLCYTATLLKNKGHNVKYIDSVYQNLNYKSTLIEIIKFKPDVLFFETSTPTFDYDCSFVDMVKKRIPNLKIVVAGTHVTFDPIGSIKKSKIDVVIKGEQDFTTLNVMNAFKNSKSLKNIKGICYKYKNKIINNPQAPLIKDLDSLPFPDRDLIPHQWYIEGHVKYTPFTFVMGSRGCPNKCTFCLWPHVYYNHTVRFRSPVNICDELEWLIKKYGIKEVFFDDSTFNVNEKRAIDISKEIIKRDIKIVWSCSARVDKVSKEMLYWMKKSGCKLICYGGESANPETLKKTDKKITLEQIRKAIKLTKESKIIAHANFMIGFPWETKKDMEKTIEFGIKTDPDTIQFSLVFPHPGSKMYKEAVEKEWFYEEVFDHMDMFDMTKGPILKTKIPKKELMKIVNKSHAKFFLRPNYILKNIYKIRDKKELFRVLKGAKSVIKGKILFNIFKKNKLN